MAKNGDTAYKRFFLVMDFGLVSNNIFDIMLNFLKIYAKYSFISIELETKINI
jgi:hypothetical protein